MSAADPRPRQAGNEHGPEAPVGPPLFTLAADLDLGAPMAPWLRPSGADVTIRQGDVPKALPKPEFEGVVWQSAGDRFLLCLPREIRILLTGGETIRYAKGPDASEADVRVFLLTMAWGILAMQRGLLPLQASSVSRGGDVHAFAGPSGAGKSTLATALTKHGFALFTDDILILDPASLGGPVCLGHRTLYMHRHGLLLVGAAASAAAPIRANVRKRQADPRQVAAHGTGRLRTLHLLTYQNEQPGSAVGTKELFGRQALLALDRALYHPREAAAVLGRRRILSCFAKAIPHLQTGTFCRRWGEEAFDADLDTLLDTLLADLAS